MPPAGSFSKSWNRSYHDVYEGRAVVWRLAYMSITAEKVTEHWRWAYLGLEASATTNKKTVQKTIKRGKGKDVKKKPAKSIGKAKGADKPNFS